MNANVGQSLSGRYKLSIINGDGAVLWEQPEYKKNLILNSGLNAIYNYPYALMAQYAIAGTGTRDNYFTSSNSKIVQVGNIIYLHPNDSDITNFLDTKPGYTDLLQDGDVIKYTNGSGSITEIMITGSVFSGSATSSVSMNIPEPGDTFTIWKTSQTSLQSETKRAGQSIPGTSYLTSGDSCGTFYGVGDYKNVITLKRTYDFAVETQDMTYAEIGTTWGQVESNIFSRIKLNPPIDIGTNQKLRLVYELDVSLTPTSSVYINNAPMAGWPISPATNTNVTQSFQFFVNAVPIITPVQSDGLTSWSPYSYPIEPHSTNGYSYNRVAISNLPGIADFGTQPIDRHVNPVDYSEIAKETTYIPNSCYVFKTVVFDVAQYNRTDIRVLSLCYGVAYPQSQHYVVQFEQSQSKFNTQQLWFTFKFSWGRTLE